MKRYAFRIVNVFTLGEDRFSGNPLCVFEDAQGLSAEQMQALARQMNLSETTFILPDGEVRIFTPGYEMPFAGHPTLGTASVIGGDTVRMRMKVGVVEVRRDGRTWTLKAAKQPVTRPVEATRDQLCEMLSLPHGSIVDEPLWVDTGSEQMVLPMASAELIRKAVPKADLLFKYGYSAARADAMAYLWARGSPDWTVRFFFTANGAVREDPATGSACANLGGWHLATGKALPVRATLRQGDAVHRPCKLGLHVAADKAIYVSGEVIELGRGTLEL